MIRHHTGIETLVTTTTKLRRCRTHLGDKVSGFLLPLLSNEVHPEVGIGQPGGGSAGVVYSAALFPSRAASVRSAVLRAALSRRHTIISPLNISKFCLAALSRDALSR